jgi:high-affinity Fe2+/Pb2+ permease
MGLVGLRRRRISYPLSAVAMAMLGTLAGFGSLSGIYSSSSFLMLGEGMILSLIVGVFLLVVKELSEQSSMKQNG